MMERFEGGLGRDADVARAAVAALARTEGDGPSRMLERIGGGALHRGPREAGGVLRQAAQSVERAPIWASPPRPVEGKHFGPGILDGIVIEWPGHRFDESSLYGPGGPRASDIQQTKIGDCYFVATLGAVAHADPQAIRDMISFDPKTGDYMVTLYDEEGRKRVIPVTQQELADNIDNRGGGSTADDTGIDAEVWPAVIETAHAKMNDSNWADGLTDGYNAIGQGGWPRDAMREITGSPGEVIRYDRSLFESRDHAMDEVYESTRQALEEGRPVTLWAVEEDRSFIDKLFGREGDQDGLRDNHLYSVEKIYRDENGEIMVELRNPRGHNEDWAIGEGGPEGAVITVPLETLVETGGMNEITVGPAL